MSVASSTDIQTTQIRRTLLAAARDHNCQALLLGHSTTALAELTLSEAAKGRGWAVPWFVGDGVAPSLTSPPPSEQPVGEGARDGNGNEKGAAASVLVYHPLRDALRKELATYATLTNPPLTPLIAETDTSQTHTGPVVSHKDLSIESVMRRYFAEVEESYPSVVANVARTTGKLVRAGGDEGCALCGMPLDEDGDERWRGELGIVKGLEVASRAGLGRRLCYGCERSVGG